MTTGLGRRLLAGPFDPCLSRDLCREAVLR